MFKIGITENTAVVQVNLIIRRVTLSRQNVTSWLCQWPIILIRLYSQLQQWVKIVAFKRALGEWGNIYIYLILFWTTISKEV